MMLVLDSLAGVCSWEVLRRTTAGSDHYPIITEEGVSLDECDKIGIEKKNIIQ